MNPLRLALLLLVGAALACGGGDESDGPRPTSVLLISIDTLRADRLGCYGYGRPTSPRLDAFAEQGTLFENVTAQSPWTLPSHATMLTGLFPHRHGVIDQDKKLGKDVPTLAAILKKSGLRTFAVVNSAWISREQGLVRGFQSFERFRDEGNHGPGINERALRWLDEHAGEPTFLFLHYYDVHSSYTPDEAFRERFALDYSGPADGSTAQLDDVRFGRTEFTPEDLRHVSDLYDAELCQLDSVLGELFDELERRGLAATTLVVITSDHGEEFGEHGGLLHGRTLYEEVLRVPLILRGPNVPAGTRVPDQARVADVVPTVLGRLGLETGHTFDGVDLFDPRSRRDLLAFAAADWKRGEPDSLRMVRTQRYKLHHDRLSGETALYDLTEDPAETRDVASDHAPLVEFLEQRMTDFLLPLHAAGPADERSQETLETLRSLGYFGDD